jgi:putative ABC transport system substrate-binding protein
MNSKLFGLFTVILLVTIHRADAQQPKKIARIGWLRAYRAAATIPGRYEAFRQAMTELGYSEGKNTVFEQRNQPADLVGLNVDVIVTTGTTGTLAAKQATSTIPIIMTTGSDPVEMRLVASLAHPGGNITGLSSGLGRSLTGKRVELLKETLPNLVAAGVLWDSADPSSEASLKEVEKLAPALRIRIHSLEVHSANDIANAFRAATEKNLQGLIIQQTALINAQRKKIIELAMKYRLPAIYGETAQVEAGGLMSYAPNTLELYRRAAVYVDKILKGAKPADLPVEQPTKFELVINLQTAKQIGLIIPPNVLARADRVIK